MIEAYAWLRKMFVQREIEGIVCSMVQRKGLIEL